MNSIGSGSSGIDTVQYLLAEHRSLLHSIVSCRAREGVHNTVRAVGHHLSVHGDGIRWFRMYSENPPWHQRSGLLNQELDKDTVLRGGPIVFYTLISPHSRKDLRVGGWHSRGNKQEICNQFVMTKLYYTGDPNRTKEDGITPLEFYLKMDRQHHVAICVLHRRDYRHLIRDLTQGTDQRNLPGNQGNQVDVPRHLPPVNLGPAAAGFMNAPQVSYTNVESVRFGPPLGNYAMNQYISALPMNEVMYNMTPGNIEATNVGYHAHFLNNGSMYVSASLGNTGMAIAVNLKSVGHSQALPYYVANPSNTWAMNNGMRDMAKNARYNPFLESYTMNPSNTLHTNGSVHDRTSSESICMGVGYPPDPSNYAEDPSNTWPIGMHKAPLSVGHHPDSSSYPMNPSSAWSMNNSMHDMSMLTEQDAHADQVSWQNDSSITSSVHSMDAFMPNQNAMAKDNAPVLPTNFPPGADLVTTEQINNEDEYSMFLDFSEHSSTIEEP